jgi:hypothetical protein
MASRLGLLSLVLGAIAMMSSGCAMCCAPFDCNYTYVGGRWVRDNPSEGRVGSAFAPAGHRVDDVPTTPHGAAPQETEIVPSRDGAEYLPTE